MWTERLSLRQRLLFWLLPPILLLTIVWLWTTYAIVLHFANRTYDWSLQDTAQTLANQGGNARGELAFDLPPAAFRMLEFDEVDKVYFSVSDDRGRQLLGNRSLPPNAAGNPPPGEARFYDARVDGKAVRLVEYTVPNEASGRLLFVRVGETLHKRQAMARDVLAYLITPQLLFLAGIVFFVWQGIGRGMAPLSRIRDAIARRTHEDLSPLGESGLPAEVHEQVHVINDLMVRLGRTITAQQRFIADATHQLRTPITVLCAQAELAQRARDPDELRAALAKLNATTVRLARLANQLLSLSRAEARLAGASAFTPVAVTALLEDVVERLVPAALAKQVEVSIELAGEPAAVSGDSQFLREMLANLVDNAIRYTSSGGRVEVGARQAGEAVVFVVTDNGPGIPEAERQRVLEPFYRSAEAGVDGSGLGLAIAHEIAILHKGRITLTTAPGGGGLTASVEIPVAPARGAGE
ncbi:MAG: sensor histidine kinase [Betaproteobacteria bacterium]|nr:sensor histidine kinase [Betaproteobacteria bacterium]MCL2886434.1 sensor histidine kinase [Betaproteobacteria bacterium]